MSAHIVCAACQKMYREVDNGEKAKVHYYGLCERCAQEDADYEAGKRKPRKADPDVHPVR